MTIEMMKEIIETPELFIAHIAIANGVDSTQMCWAQAMVKQVTADYNAMKAGN